jgi:ribonuclease-3
MKHQAEPPADLARLAPALGHSFAEPRLLEEALTHPSATTGRSRKARGRDYNRLEFLGDRVLGLLVADLLHRRYPQADAGELARRFNALVRQESLAMVAEAVDLGGYLRLSRSERDTGGAAKPAILADACEAVIAALYLDGGLEAARAFIHSRFEPLLAEVASPAKDAKTALQEWAAARSLPPPTYQVAAQEGPPHEPMFTVTVGIEGFSPATGRGRSKRTAEQAAARGLLKTLPKGHG